MSSVSQDEDKVFVVESQQLNKNNKYQKNTKFLVTCFICPVLYRIFFFRPELYGNELAVHLSKVLNVSRKEDGSLPSSLALEGIKHLCRGNIVDAATVWTTLKPSFNNESRTLVLKRQVVSNPLKRAEPLRFF